MKTANVKDNALGIKKGRKYKSRSRDTLMYLYRNIRILKNTLSFGKYPKQENKRIISFSRERIYAEGQPRR